MVLGGGGVFVASKGEDVQLTEGETLILEIEEAASVPVL